MTKYRGLIVAVSVVVSALVLGAIYTAFTINNRNLNEVAKKNNPEEIQAQATFNEIWGKYYPRHWESYQKGLLSDTVTKYGGNVHESKLDEFPYLRILYKGLGYSEEFWEPRGHPYAVQDINSVPGSRRKSGGTCLTCKSPQVPSLIEQYGDNFYSAPYDEMVKHVKDPIGCSDCHDPETNELRITRPALIKAWERQGKDITKATKQEMRSLVCAQCHVTYYFLKDTKEATFPWDEGLKADEVYKYYQNKNYTEWVQPIVQTGLVKARHPDYELFVGSTHHRAGVSCADCHMPYVRQGDTKITSHWWVSPLITADVSCSPCHPQGAEFQRKRVESIQDRHNEIMDLAAQANVKAVNTIKEALQTPGADKALIEKAQDSYRKAFWYFDWVSTANSVGFHNPQEASGFLASSIQFANDATQAAREAIQKKP